MRLLKADGRLTPAVSDFLSPQDEPTNHLDSAAIRWLGQFLRSSSGTFVIVSHDEQLLEDACDHIVEVSRGCKHTAGILWGCHGHILSSLFDSPVD